MLSSKSPTKPTSSSLTPSRTVCQSQRLQTFTLNETSILFFQFFQYLSYFRYIVLESAPSQPSSLLSVPSMHFEKTVYTAKEKDSVLHIPIFRTGDLSFKSSVRCYTRTMSAMVMDDFEERRNTDESRIIFLKGEKVEFSLRCLSEVDFVFFLYIYFCQVSC